MAKIYTDYRGDEYFRRRNSWEPSYTRRMNDVLGGGQDVVELRRRQLTQFLKESMCGMPTVALDVGGDRGQFIPDGIGRRLVLEVSGAQPVCGVSSVSSPRCEQATGVELVMLCGVLEHIPDPHMFLQGLVNEVQWGRREFLYVEVPSGTPSIRSDWGKGIAFGVGLAASTSRVAWRWMDARAARWRRARSTPWPLMPLRLSEHLNFFTTRGLQDLVRQSGFDVVSVGRVEVPASISMDGRLAFEHVLRLIAIRT